MGRNWGGGVVSAEEGQSNLGGITCPPPTHLPPLGCCLFILLIFLVHVFAVGKARGSEPAWGGAQPRTCLPQK